MQKVSIWWLFLVLFGLTIGGIQTLGYWARPASAQSPAATHSAASTSAALRHQNGEPKHWRSMIMQQ